ncbi:MAG TPA: hypothetical protein VM802_20725 [Chitinophaga sp.]|uniref:hypothetical protein n=1 Tax=Chitinophaga sp. TaxID=1869181 RepID=UPI002C2E2A9F|nr:hypothetical protein [Chitinophaga sp.]HVI47315.1 hypothetical protein [Chitinophaga sp.]
MKLKLSLLLLPILFMLSSFRSDTSSAFGKKNFDLWIKDQNGKSHHIHGWIEYTLLPPGISHGDVWYDGDHIVWKATVPNPRGIPDYIIDIESKTPELVPLQLIYDTMVEQIPDGALNKNQRFQFLPL